MRSEDQFMQRYEGHMASQCKAQVPVFNRVGRGLRGNSFKIDASISDNKVILTGIETDHSKGEETEAWKFDITSMVPFVDYRLYNGVRQIGDQYYNGWYIRMKSSIKEAGFAIWDFTTPFTPTTLWEGTGEIPPDEIVSSSF